MDKNMEDHCTAFQYMLDSEPKSIMDFGMQLFPMIDAFMKLTQDKENIYELNWKGNVGTFPQYKYSFTVNKILNYSSYNVTITDTKTGKCESKEVVAHSLSEIKRKCNQVFTNHLKQ